MQELTTAPARRFTDGLLSETEVAEELGLGARTLRLWRQQRRGPPFIKVGNSIRYREEALRQWLRDLEVAPARSRRA